MRNWAPRNRFTAPRQTNTGLRHPRDPEHRRAAVVALDEIFGTPTDLPLGKHIVDTAGQTLATFAIFNLAGLQSSPPATEHHLVALGA